MPLLPSFLGNRAPLFKIGRSTLGTNTDHWSPGMYGVYQVFREDLCNYHLDSYTSLKINPRLGLSHQDSRQPVHSRHL